MWFIEIVEIRSARAYRQQLLSSDLTKRKTIFKARMHRFISLIHETENSYCLETTNHIAYVNFVLRGTLNLTVTALKPLCWFLTAQESHRH